MKDTRLRPNRRIAVLIAFAVLLYAFVMNLGKLGNALGWLIGLLMPVVMGLAFALIIDVPMHSFQKLFSKLDRQNRLPQKLWDALSLTLSVVLIPVLLTLLIRFVVPQFISAVTNVISIINASTEQIGRFAVKIGLDPAIVTNTLKEIGEWVNNNITHIAGTTFSTAMSIFSSATNVVLALIMAIYLIWDKRALSRRTHSLMRAFLPQKIVDYLCHVTKMFISVFRVFLGRQCLESLILGTMLMIAMLIFRIPYAFTICCMTALLALLPYVGAYASFFIGCVLIMTDSPMKALVFAIVFIVMQQVEGNIIYPRVVGKSVGLPAYVTLAAVMIGGALAGIAGMFFIIPVVSVLYELLRESVQRRNAAKDAAIAAAAKNEADD